jgi:hypothetical protein
MADALVQLGAIRGQAGRVHVVLTGLVVRDTGKGLRSPYPEFGSELLAGLHEKLVAPAHRGFFRSRTTCPVCSTALDGLPAQSVGIATEVTLQSIPPVQVDLAIPGVFCPTCRMQLVLLDDRKVASDLSDALIAALKSAAIKPG